MCDVDLCAGHGLKVCFCGISQSQEAISVFKEGGIVFCSKETFVVRGIFHELVVFPGPLMSCYELFFVIDRYELIIGLNGKSS